MKPLKGEHIGSMNELCTIQQNIINRSSSGHSTLTWQTIANNVFVAVDWTIVFTREEIEADALHDFNGVGFRVRINPDYQIKPEWRVLFRGESYDIIGVLEYPGRAFQLLRTRRTHNQDVITTGIALVNSPGIALVNSSGTALVNG